MIQYCRKTSFLYCLLGMFLLAALAHEEVSIAAGLVITAVGVYLLPPHLTAMT